MRGGGHTSVPHFAGTGAQESVAREEALCYDKENLPLDFDVPSTGTILSGRETSSWQKVEKAGKNSMKI